MALSTDLRAYWKLDEASGNASDSSGNGYTMTNGGSSGVTFTTGKMGNAAHFENTYPNNQDSFSRSGLGSDCSTYTISAWIKSSDTTINTDNGIISGGSWGGAGAWVLMVRTNGSGVGALRWDVYGNTTGDGISSTTTGIFNGSWRHVAVTYSDSTDTLKFYIDGRLDKTSTSVNSGTIDLTSINIYLGQYLVGSNYRGFANGEIDEVGVWSRVLTDDEISQVYNSGRGNTTPFVDIPDHYGCLGYYNLDTNSVDSIAARNGTDSSMSYGSPYKITGAAQFNGSSSTFTIPFSLGAQGTANFWFKKANAGESPGSVFGITLIGTSDYLRINPASTVIQYCVQDNFTAYNWTADTDWHMATIAWDSNAAWTGYLDGALVTTGAGVRNPTNGYNLRFGILSNGNGTYTSGQTWYTGSIDEVGYWDRRLTGTEISTLYNGGAGLQYPFSIPVAPTFIQRANWFM